MSSSSVAAVVTRRATTATRATIRGSPRFTSPLLEKPSLHEAYPSESSDTVACAGSVVCHNAPTLRGLSEQLGPGLWAPFPPSLPPDRCWPGSPLQSGTASLHNGIFFFLKTRSEQEGIQRDGMQPATTPPTGSFLHQPPLQRRQFETRSLTQH